jgi:hypothetical protein
MKNKTGIARGGLWTTFLAGALVLLAAVCQVSAAATGPQVAVPLLHVGADYFTNATVTPQSSTHVTVLHSRGMTMAKVADLDPDIQRQLGLDPGLGKGSRANATRVKQESQAGAEQVQADNESKGPPLLRTLRKLGREAEQQAEDANATDRLEKATMTEKIIGFAMMVGLVVFYFMFSRACHQLCRRAGAPSDFLVWLPGWKRLALFRATNTSWWWFFLGLIPVLGLPFWFLGWLLCCMRLCEAFGHSRWWTLAMLVNIGGWVVFLHFAQASRGEDNEPAVRSINRGFAY